MSPFVGSKEILPLLAMVKRYNKLPSELMSIEDDYTAYCFNEACAFILGELEAGEEIHFKKQYNSFTQLYAQYDN